MSIFKFITTTATISLMIACTPQPKTYTAEEMQKICSTERDKADGVSGKTTIGTSTKRGPFMSVSIELNDNLGKDLDPELVYKQCMERLRAENTEAMAAK